MQLLNNYPTEYSAYLGQSLALEQPTLKVPVDEVTSGGTKRSASGIEDDLNTKKIIITTLTTECSYLGLPVKDIIL